MSSLEPAAGVGARRPGGVAPQSSERAHSTSYVPQTIASDTSRATCQHPPHNLRRRVTDGRTAQHPRLAAAWQERHLPSASKQPTEPCGPATLVMPTQRLRGGGSSIVRRWRSPNAESACRQPSMQVRRIGVAGCDKTNDLVLRRRQVAATVGQEGDGVLAVQHVYGFHSLLRRAQRGKDVHATLALEEKHGCDHADRGQRRLALSPQSVGEAASRPTIDRRRTRRPIDPT